MAKPLTRPGDWFIHDRQNPHSDLSRLKPWTDGNRVTPLIDGKAYFEQFHKVITNVKRGDFVHFAGWRMDRVQRLLAQNPASQVDVKFFWARKKEADVRVLLSGHFGAPVWGANRAMWLYCNDNGIQCIVDARFPLAGSAHQKFAVIKNANHYYGFCGGIDLALSRWDTPNHEGGDVDLKKKEPDDGTKKRQFETFYAGGWHDVHCMIEGPAIEHLERTFRERWHDPITPNSARYSKLIERAVKLRLKVQRVTKIQDPLPKPSRLSWRGQGDPGMSVQILRTYSCRGSKYQFALKGEFTARRAVLKAIAQARNYIYIEDQYFASHVVAEALEQALKSPDPAKKELRVIVLVPAKGDTFAKHFNYHQHQIIERLKKAAPKRFAIYHLRNTNTDHRFFMQPIYVHSKIMIVDDVFALIGSQNLLERSLSHDAELCAAIVDSKLVDGTFNGQTIKVGEFPHKLRLKLWAEHLQSTREDDPAFLDPVKGFDEWKKQGDEPNPSSLRETIRRVRTHTAPTPRSNSVLWRRGISPSGLCRGDKDNQRMLLDEEWSLERAF